MAEQGSVTVVALKRLVNLGRFIEVGDELEASPEQAETLIAEGSAEHKATRGRGHK